MTFSGILLFMVVLLIGNVCGKENWMNILVDTGKKICFYETVTDRMDLKYQVMQGGKLDIGIQISIGDRFYVNKISYFDDVTIESRGNEFEEVHLKGLNNGEYKICMSNTDVSKGQKLVSFLFHGWKPTYVTEYKTKPIQKEELKEIDKKILKISTELENIDKFLQYSKRRLHRHMWTLESTSNRTSLASIIKSVIIVAIVGIQIYVVQQWFKAKKISFRV
mmetsp:Transcript_53701/g.65841  ORF Transcript_53701/g.65841 Transcript_53701/m.65841 type:complete len:221 (-) Transcript_53701:18-680(-)